MGARQALHPKQPRNLAWTVGVCALLVLVWTLGAWFGSWTPSHGLGLWFGILAAAFFVFEMAYPARRPRARPLLTARNWLQAHVYLGAVALLAVLIHTGFAWPHGAMGWLLLLLSAWTTLTGLLGVWLQKWIPAALADGLRVEVLYERIPPLLEGLVAEADALMDGASELVERFYRVELRDGFARPSPSWSYLFDVRSGRERALEPLRRLGQFVEPAEKGRVDDLTSLFTEKLELDAHLTLQGVLRRWLVLHLPFAGLLTGLLTVHVLAWAWY